MEIEPKKFNEFRHLGKLDAEHTTIEKTSWVARKEIWAKNKNIIVILCGDKHWKMSRTEWAKLYRKMNDENK